MGSASVLLDGNQAKRANFFKVSSSGSGVGPQSAEVLWQVPKVVLRDVGMDISGRGTVEEQEDILAKLGFFVTCPKSP